MGDFDVADVLWFFPEDFRGGRIHGNNIPRHQQGLFYLNVGGFGICRARGAVAHQYAVGVYHIEIRFAVQAEIRDALIQTGQVIFHAIFDNAHHVFHRDGQMRGTVMFEYRHIDKRVTIQNQAVYIRRLKRFAAGDSD